MFFYDQNTELQAEQVLSTCTHLRDFAEQLGVDTGMTAGMDIGLGCDQLEAIAQALREAIAAALAEEERNKRWPCNIGPYANGICTICGGAQP